MSIDPCVDASIGVWKKYMDFNCTIHTKHQHRVNQKSNVFYTDSNASTLTLTANTTSNYAPLHRYCDLQRVIRCDIQEEICYSRGFAEILEFHQVYNNLLYVFVKMNTCIMFKTCCSGNVVRNWPA